VPGSKLGGFEVRSIHAVERGLMRIVCVKDKALVRLDIALADEADGAPPPPATAGRYAIFYSLRGATPEDAERLATHLARVLKNNAAVMAPPGLTPFRPAPNPGTTL
jgi:hypothetical protein